MALRRTLTWLATYPAAASDRLIATSVMIARAHSAQLNALATTPRLPRSGHWMMGGMMSGMASEIEQRAKRAADELSVRFDMARREAGLEGSSSRLEIASYEAGGALGPLARLHDLILTELGRGEETKSEVEALIFLAARPVLVLPAGQDGPSPARLNRLAIAWDGSRTATRAVHDAMPLLETASSVEIIAIIDDKDMKHLLGAGSLSELLACHGIESKIREVKGSGKPTAVVLKRAVEEASADALVMGAYGHSRTREFVLGGATMGMLAGPEFPVLFSH